MVKEYVPDRGELVWLDFNPQTGHEQAGHRPALILSPRAYNKIGLAVMCPVTTKSKGYPFEVKLKGIENVRGFVLADQVKNLDWRDRGARYIGKVHSDVLHQVLQKVVLLLGLKITTGMEKRSQIHSGAEESGFFVIQNGKEGPELGCCNPEKCQRQADAWRKRQSEAVPIGEQLLQGLLEHLEDGGSLPMSRHAGGRGYDRAFSAGKVSEAIRNGWVIEHDTERQTLLVLYYLKLSAGVYRPVHVVLGYRDGKWKVVTVYDPRTMPWKWNRNFDERICFCE
jgi:mRNA interferase MazF